MAHHLTCRSRPGTLAFCTHSEARLLWDRVLRHVPDPVALCLMPDHVHLLHRQDVRTALGAALAAFAQVRNSGRGEHGQVWQRMPRTESVEGRVKLRRAERYIHLNPCRAGLVSDPLAWPWSTHRDRVGLALPLVRPTHPDPHGFHAYVSADPTVNVQGTLLPQGSAPASVEAVVAAVSAVTRTPAEDLLARGARRSFLLRCLRCLTQETATELARELRLHRSTLARAPDLWTPEVRRLARVLEDPRFDALQPGDLRRQPGWGRYRARR